MTPFDLTLSYTLADGWLAPWTKALKRGQALGRACASCGRVSFVPLRICPCGSSDGTWTQLSPIAALKWRTVGQDGDFALVRFPGADTDCTVSLYNVPNGAEAARLCASNDGVPRLILGPTTEDSQ